MVTDMLDQLQQRKLRGLEELVDSWKVVAHADGCEQAAVADFIVDEAIGLRQGLLRLWEIYWTNSLAGRIGDRRREGAKLRVLFEHGGRVLIRAAEAARAFSTLSGLEIARLAAFEEQAAAFPHKVQECLALWEAADKPRKPLNVDRIAQSRAAYLQGLGEDAATIAARIEQGGPIVKE